MSRRAALTLTAVLVLSPLAALAADTGGSASEAPASTAPAPLGLGTPTTAATATTAGKASGAKSASALLAEARTAIAAKKWSDAMVSLKTAAELEPTNADVQNLLGFSSRNLGDYPAAMKYYDVALKLNPKHIGALEYQGIAYLKLGQAGKAKANLASLKKICGADCEEYKDLAKALKTTKKTK
jgi:tetratricopeptide (TPR) repeat protein